MRIVWFVLALLATAAPAHADPVWMVKSSGVIGCADRQTVVELDAAERSGGGLPEGCVELYSGERLLEQHDVGVGFDDYMRAQRGDARIVFVRRSAVVSDVGIGSMTDDRR